MKGDRHEEKGLSFFHIHPLAHQGGGTRTENKHQFNMMTRIGTSTPPGRRSYSHPMQKLRKHKIEGVGFGGHKT